VNDNSTVYGIIVELLWGLCFEHFKFKSELIDRDFVQSCVGLKHACVEALREEEP
jgi:hypothetical protein